MMTSGNVLTPVVTGAVFVPNYCAFGERLSPDRLSSLGGYNRPVTVTQSSENPWLAPADSRGELL